MNPVTVGAALSLLEEGEAFAWLTIIDSRGSSPRHVGSSMLVRADGSIAGTIGGGALEAAAIRDAVRATAERESRLMDYNLTNEDSARLGMICGGSGTILIDYVDPGNEAAKDYYRALHELLERGVKGWSVITLPEEHTPGWTAWSCVVAGGTPDKVISAPGYKTYIMPVGLQGAAYVFGAGHCGEKLVPLLSMVGFHTVVVDDRAEFANVARFPAADRIVVPDSFEGALEQLPIDEDSYVVIMTRGHVHDRSLLKQALGRRPAYVGMIGSKKKVAETFRTLSEEGVLAEDIARVHAPIGLSIGAETPEEIAVSIVAQLIQVRASAH